MQVFGIHGWSGSGKTELLSALIPLLRAKGLSVSTIKHAHHDFDIDQKDKDSYRHRSAGAQEVLISSPRRYALIHELRDQAELSLDQLLLRLAPVDLVLVEGFKFAPIAKLEVWRKALNKPALWPEQNHVLAVASPDEADASCPCVWLDLNDHQCVVDFIFHWYQGKQG